MKFNKGDKVKVIHMPSHCRGEFPKDMLGKIVTIEGAYVGPLYCVDDNRWHCNFRESDLEFATPQKLMDLKFR